MEFEKIIAERPNKTIYKNGDCTVKVFAEDFSKADILNEALNTARVEETGLPIPKVVEVTKISVQYGLWLQAIVDFFIIALSVFVAVRVIRKMERKLNAKEIAKKEAEAAAKKAEEDAKAAEAQAAVEA